MNEFLKEIARLWWVEVGTELQNPLSEKSIRGLRKVLKEEYDFDSEVIEYIIESAVKTPTNFHLGGDRTSGMVVGTNDTAVSAHLHTDDNEEEDVVEEEEEKDEEETSTDKERPDSGDDKEKVKKDIGQNALTSYEKEKLKEIDDKLLKHKLMNPTTNNLNQVSTLLGKKSTDPKAYSVAKSWLGDKGVSDDEIEKQSDSSDKSDSDVKSEKLKKVLQDVGTSTNPEIRITSKAVLQEFNDDTERSDKEKKEIREMLDSVETLEGDFKERALVLTAIGQLYGTRENSGFMKNNLGLADRDQMVKNEKNLMELYDDAKPELVEKGVRKVRKNKVSEKFVAESFDTLPPKLKKYLSSAGNGGKDVGENHFLGYRKEDGSITSDINEAGENAEIVRGKVPSKDRAKLAWRMYLEQGGVCGYSGLPLDLEEMDLEHVVGMQNDDKGSPTDADVLNRENEKNQILVSSRFNQKKSDLNMDEFYKREIEPLKSKSKEDFEKLEKGKKAVKKIKPQTEQTALRLMDEVSFRIAGGGTITQSEYEKLDDDKKPELTLSEDGVPKVKSAIIGPNVTQESLIKEFEMEDARYSEIKETMLGEVTDKDDISKIKKLNTKIGKRVIQAMGLPGNLPNENRRTNSISSNDEFYRGFTESMAALPVEKRQEARKAWKEAIADGSKRDKDGNLLNGKKYGKVQKDEFCKYLRDRGFISDEMVAKYPIWRYRNSDGKKV